MRQSGRYLLRELQRIEKTGGYPTDEQVSQAMTIAEALMSSDSERAKAAGAALIVKAREAATRRGMAVLGLAEGIVNTPNRNTVNINTAPTIVLTGECWGKMLDAARKEP